MKAYRQKWLPPPTIDCYLYEVQQDIWWGHRSRAKRTLLWLMEKYLGDDHEKEASLEEGDSSEGEEGEDVYYIPSE